MKHCSWFLMVAMICFAVNASWADNSRMEGLGAHWSQDDINNIYYNPSKVTMNKDLILLETATPLTVGNQSAMFLYEALPSLTVGLGYRRDQNFIESQIFPTFPTFALAPPLRPIWFMAGYDLAPLQVGASLYRASQSYLEDNKDTTYTEKVDFKSGIWDFNLGATYKMEGTLTAEAWFGMGFLSHYGLTETNAPAVGVNRITDDLDKGNCMSLGIKAIIPFGKINGGPFFAMDNTSVAYITTTEAPGAGSVTANGFEYDIAQYEGGLIANVDLNSTTKLLSTFSAYILTYDSIPPIDPIPPATENTRNTVGEEIHTNTTISWPRVYIGLEHMAGPTWKFDGMTYRCGFQNWSSHVKTTVERLNYKYITDGTLTEGGAFICCGLGFTMGSFNLNVSCNETDISRIPNLFAGPFASFLDVSLTYKFGGPETSGGFSPAPASYAPPAAEPAPAAPAPAPPLY